jgi:cell shape-determining protein MreD
MRATAWTALALLSALVIQTTLSQIVPARVQTLDPFLLVVVYCGLSGGEMHGMLSGAVAGWIEDASFGGPVVGLSGLSKLLVGFGVGLVSGRFLITGPGLRLLLVFTAATLDALFVEQFASTFDIRISELSLPALLGRSAANALLGAGLYELVDRRLRRERRS